MIDFGKDAENSGPLQILRGKEGEAILENRLVASQRPSMTLLSSDPSILFLIISGDQTSLHKNVHTNAHRSIIHES